MARLISNIILWIVALFYAYGAFVHVANIAGLNGFDWLTAPLKWQILDVAYLGLDIVVALGLIIGRRIGVVAFFVAAVSQILLYTIFRAWILDVPEAFARTPEEITYLDTLVAFHLVTIAAVAIALLLGRTSAREGA